MKNEITIVLPEEIAILRDKKYQDAQIDKEEFSIYFKNIIYPYKDEYDIQVDCDYGRNLGHCWRIDQFADDVEEFDLAIKIYGDFGKLLAQKSCKVKISEKCEKENVNLLCIGDSMTRAEIYIQQTVNKARNISTIGIRNIAYNVNHEGRGGWKCSHYFDRFADSGDGVSPFLFPVGYSGKEYFGDKAYWEKIASCEYNSRYSYSGIKPETISGGMVCLDNGSLYRYNDGRYELIDENPHFEFSFKKYIERYNLNKPDMVSLLFGANEFQHISYENFEKELKIYLAYLKQMIESIKEYDSSIKIIVNLPICGGDQYSWGKALGCISTSKQYDYCIKMASKALIENFDKQCENGIFICPMLLVCDTDAGFPWEEVKSNIYSDKTYIRCANWVHPSEVGYRQMGDALAAVINKIR